MKKITLYLAGFAFSTLLFSCGTTNVTRFGGNELEVAATIPNVVNEVKVESTNINKLETSSTATISELAATPSNTKTSKAVEKFNQNAQKLSNALKTLTATTNDAFTKKTLTITSNNIDKLNVNVEKLSFLDKIKMRLFGKMFNRYAEKLNSAMDTADILAICALVSGCLAWVTFYGSFLFGVAGIVLGAIALKKGTSRRGMALAGIILGAVGLFLWLVLILFVIGATAAVI